ncbi:MAG: hypothetical protein Q8K30_06200 [Candidatus Gracilibacteria bacterium]|nr:hypothetical protein [Candidatus Gracilibacteria bacterium]
MTIEKFRHLDNKKPNVQEIIKTPVDLVNNDQLGALGDHFNNIKEKYSTDIEISQAASLVLEKIDRIISLGKNKVSGETMKAANEQNYSVSKLS